jgi:hypothetical protein
LFARRRNFRICSFAALPSIDAVEQSNE